MIRIIIICSYCLSFIPQGFTQEFSVGIVNGINFGGPVGKVDSAEGQPALGFESGLYGSYKISDRISLKPMLYYTRKGASYNKSYTRDTIVEVEIQGTTGSVPTFYDAEVAGKVVLHYLEFPFLISYENKKRFFIEFGPYLSYLLKGRDIGHLRLEIGEDNFITDASEFDNNYAFNSFDYGLIFSAGYSFPFGMGIYLKGSRGFRQVYKSDYFTKQGQSVVRLYNTFVSIGLRYQLDFKKG